MLWAVHPCCGSGPSTSPMARGSLPWRQRVPLSRARSVLHRQAGERHSIVPLQVRHQVPPRRLQRVWLRRLRRSQRLDGCRLCRVESRGAVAERLVNWPGGGGVRHGGEGGKGCHCRVEVMLPCPLGSHARGRDDEMVGVWVAQRLCQGCKCWRAHHGDGTDDLRGPDICGVVVGASLWRVQQPGATMHRCTGASTSTGTSWSIKATPVITITITTFHCTCSWRWG